MIRTIRLDKLVASPRNARRRIDVEADKALKADIEAHGLLQNLVVTALSRPRGKFAVEAGERRRRALKALVEDGTLARDHEVACFVVDSQEAAREASLAENFQRLAMNPADECLAFSALVAQGLDAAAIARNFGLTIRFVEGRLRLADLAPVIFEALGAGEIGLDVAKAYAATPDRERQAFVYEQMGKGYSANHPDSIRRMMTQATVSAADRRARLVGEEAYLAAGGRIERDLFAEEEDVRWRDIALVERLATERMAELAAAAAAEAGLAFVRPTLESWVRHDQLAGLRRIHVAAPPLSEEETGRLDDLEGELEALLNEMEAADEADDETCAAARDKVRSLNQAIAAIAEKPLVLDPELAATAGTFLLLGEDGAARLDRSFYVAEGEGDAPEDGDRESANGGSPDAAKSRGGGLSRRLVDELAMQRRDILAAHVAADPGLALDLAIFLMVDRGYSCERAGSTLRAPPPTDPASDFQSPEARATRAREQAAAALALDWTEGDTLAERFDRFRALPEEARAAWLGHAVARSLEASLNLPGARACEFHAHLGALLGIDVAAWWRPTAANYFDRVPKSLALAALAGIGGEALAGRYAKAKKAELVEACERIFAGDFIAEVEVKDAALAWMPDEMRFDIPSVASEAPDTEQEASLDGESGPESAQVDEAA